MAVRAIFAIAVLGCALGCTGELGTEGHVDYVSGALGRVDLTGSTPQIREVSLRDNVLHIDLRMQDELGRFAMIALDIPADGDGTIGSTELALRPGDAELIGCSGDVEDDWEYDCTPEVYTVGITPKAERVEFTAEFPCDTPDGTPPEDPTVEGSVDLI